MNLRKHALSLSMAFLANILFLNTICSRTDNPCKIKSFTHDIQLQLCDSLGNPVPKTKFWVTLEILKVGPWVTLQIPLINFQTGPEANIPDEPNPLLPGGYLYTNKGFLPEKIRPAELVPHSVIAASNNGLSPVYSFDQDQNSLPLPPAGYIVQITNAGALVIQGAGEFGNIIAPGPQILMPTTLSYFVNKKSKLCKNKLLSRGFTNTTQFTSQSAADSGFRDSHVNDAFDGVFGWAWTDNSMVKDKTNGTLNLMVAIGHVDKKGKLRVEEPIQLTDLEPGVLAWDTAVAINRTDKNNIVVSYGHIDTNVGQSLLYRAVSFDGGKTWPENGPLNIQPPFGFGDARGVSSDKFGNIWYSATSLEELYTPAVFYVSSDQGVTFEQAFIAPDSGSFNRKYDYPQFCFGVDGNGNYGLHFQCTIINETSPLDQTPTVGFIQINGLGDFGASQFTELPGFLNSAVESALTASEDGRIWFQGIPNYKNAYTYISPINILFKAGGALDRNYAGAWHTIIFNNNAFQNNNPSTLSQPIKGYIAHSTQSILYDEQRQALYAVAAAQEPDYSQNMRIYFIISRDNGQTWSDPIDISSSNFANRGFQSMALDEVTGDLVFGWYDGRNDPNFKSVEYFAGIIPAKTLDELVAALPLSNPHYIVPSAA